MFAKLTTIAAAAMLVSFSAFAQDSQNNEAESSGPDDHHQVWSGATGEAFFSDMKARTLRPQEEWSANWTKLTDDQRASIKQNCTEASQTNRDEAETEICTFVGKN